MKRFPAVLFVLLSAVSGWSQGLEDWYAQLSALAGVDKNAGQTTFLTLVVPPGGMYQAMGTAYSAVLKDSGYLEANPAGSALLKETELSVYHNDWIADSRVETVVFTIRQGDLGVGVGAKLLYLPFTGVNTWGERYKNSWSQDYAKGYYTEFIGTANVAYTALGNYYFHGLTLGANLKLAQRSVPEALAQNQSALGLMADFGLLTRFNLLKFYASRERNLSLSAVLKNFGAPVGGDGLPTAFVFGLAYSPFRPITVSLDGTFPHNLTGALDLGYLSQLQLGPKDESASVAVGTDIVLAPIWALQAGLEIKPGRPRLTAGTTLKLDQLTLNVSYTVDLLTTLAIPDRLSVEVKLNLGDLGRKEIEDRARDHYLDGLDAYARGNLDDAVIQWDRALALFPSFLPAKELRDTAQRALDLQKAMIDKQTVGLETEAPAPKP